jgi:peptide-methionine (S)-S-oxide reductase
MNKIYNLVFYALLTFQISTTIMACSTDNQVQKINKPITSEVMNKDTAILGGGCFWCVEAIYTDLKGVLEVTSGYSGGNEVNPSYKEVAYGLTGHAEVVRVVFDSDVINFRQVLEVFFSTHDPTTLNRQGNDVGPQYRSAIFYLNEDQKLIAEDVKQNFASEMWDGKIVTEITQFNAFYEAEDYHQDYFANNPNQPYCRAIINPKVAKFRKNFSHLLKDQ